MTLIQKLKPPLNDAEANALHDGNFAQSHFVGKNPFNEESANVVVDYSGHLFYEEGGRVNFIDLGAGSGDMSLEIARVLSGLGLDHRAQVIAVDYDADKLNLKESGERVGVIFIAASLNDLPFDTRTSKVVGHTEQKNKFVIVSRAVTQYYASDLAKPGEQFSSEQATLYNYYLERFEPGTIFIDIISTGDAIGINRFAYILNKINGKHLHYLTPGAQQKLLSTSHTNGKAFKLVEMKPLNERKGVDFGKRNIEDLYVRYGGDKTLEEFSGLVRQAWEDSKAAYPGDTKTIRQVGGDLVIDLEYYVSVASIVRLPNLPL